MENLQKELKARRFGEECSRIFLKFATVGLALWMGCATRPSGSGNVTAKSADEIVMVLDNMAFQNEGYQVALWRNGSFSEVYYTDYSEPRLSRGGQYRLNGDQLRLTDSHGELEYLYRVSFEQFDYWVHAEDHGKLTDDFFRFRALKTVPIEQAQHFVWWKLHQSPELK